MEKKDKILKLIQEIDHKKAINFYFDLNKYLIEKLNLWNDDPRFSINSRYDSKKRFSTNINSRLVLGLIPNGSEPVFMLMMYDKDVKNIKKIELLEHFKGGIEKTMLVYITFKQFASQEQIIKMNWIKCCMEYLPQEKGSRFKHSGVFLLFEMSTDDKIRKEIFKSADSLL